MSWKTGKFVLLAAMAVAGTILSLSLLSNPAMISYPVLGVVLGFLTLGTSMLCMAMMITMLKAHTVKSVTEVPVDLLEPDPELGPKGKSDQAL